MFTGIGKSFFNTDHAKGILIFAAWSAACFCAMYGILPVVHVASATVLIALLWCHKITTPIYLKVAAWIAVFVVGVFMAVYRPDGFSYVNSISVESLHEQGKPYQQYINLGKFFGALILFLWLMPGLIKEDLRLALNRRSLLMSSLSVMIVLGIAVLLLGLSFTPKLPTVTLTFLTINLIVTCFAEETFYRLVVQKPTEAAFKTRWASLAVGVVIATVFFAVTHFSDQTEVMVVMATAGLVYALTFALTRSLAATILVHFSVNALHFLLLPYPL